MMNWNLVGHEWAVSLLKQHVAQNQARHAYLFTGPQGAGRRTLALRLAQALNCMQPVEPGEPCGVCRACETIARMQHPDLMVVQAEQRGGTLKVDQVRELQHSLALAPYEARYRVTVVLRFEEANPSAANALLKTLEEPPPQVVLVLTAESAESLLPTIVSRCEVLRLRPLPLDQVRQGLESRWGLEEERARLLAHISGGRPGYAVYLNADPERMERRQGWLDDQAQLLNSSRVKRFAFAEGLAKDKDTFRDLLLVWLSYWRDVLLRAAGASVPVVNLDRREEIELLAGRVGLHPARYMVAAIERKLALLDRNANTRLVAEVLLLELPYL